MITAPTQINAWGPECIGCIKTSRHALIIAIADGQHIELALTLEQVAGLIAELKAAQRAKVPVLLGRRGNAA